MHRIGIVAVAFAMAAAPISSSAWAQNRNVVNQQGGLVNVTVNNVDILKNFANENEIQILNDANIAVPITVQAPINVAANVCGVEVNALAKGGPSTNTCTAEQGSEALTDLAIEQLS